MVKKIIIFAILVIAVLFPMPENNHPAGENSMFRAYKVPGEVSEILRRSCNDCHTGQTRYEWYHKVAPLSWGVYAHIKEGKKHLNFDKWMVYNPYQKRSIFDDLHEVLDKRNMPLISYIMFHPETRLGDKEVEILRQWFEELERKELKTP